MTAYDFMFLSLVSCEPRVRTCVCVRVSERAFVLACLLFVSIVRIVYGLCVCVYDCFTGRRENLVCV